LRSSTLYIPASNRASTSSFVLPAHASSIHPMTSLATIERHALKEIAFYCKKDAYVTSPSQNETY
jgi:hypothetical protein